MAIGIEIVGGKRKRILKKDTIADIQKLVTASQLVLKYTIRDQDERQVLYFLWSPSTVPGQAMSVRSTASTSLKENGDVTLLQEDDR